MDYAKYLNDIKLSIHSPLLMLSSGVPPYLRASLSLSDRSTEENGIIAGIFLGGDLEVGGGLTTARFMAMELEVADSRSCVAPVVGKNKDGFWWGAISPDIRVGRNVDRAFVKGTDTSLTRSRELVGGVPGSMNAL